MRQYHIQLEAGEVGEFVLLPGDPGRCELIASRFDNAALVRSNREFTTYTGSLDGVAVSVCSTGIGSPSTAIAAEELINVGAKTLIRVGTCGALQPELKFGDIVVAQAAVRDDGTSYQYVPASFPAVATFDVVCKLRDAAAAAKRPYHVGVVSSKDAFYPEIESQRMPLADDLQRNLLALKRSGCLAAEMECAALFVIGAVRKVRVGGVVGVVNEAGAGSDVLPEAKRLPMEATIDTAVDALRLLIAADSAQRELSGSR